MKNKNIKLLLLFLLLAGVSVTSAQKKAKIKGNRIVKFIQTPLEHYTTLEIGEGLEISLVQGQAPMVEIEADENLHEVIDVTSSGGRLMIQTTKRIASRKALNIRVYHTGELIKVIAKEEAKISSLGDISLGRLYVEASNAAELYLTLRADEFKLTASEKTKTELNLTSDNAAFVLNDDTKIEALVNAGICSFDMYQKANARIDGDVNQLTLDVDNSAVFSGKKLTAKNTGLVAGGRSESYINTADNLAIEASGDAEVYIYNSPEIDLRKFEGRAILYKKEE